MKHFLISVFLFSIAMPAHICQAQSSEKDSLAADLFKLGNQSFRAGNFDSATIYLDKSMVLYKELGKKTEQANIHQTMGGVYHFQGQFAESIQHLQNAANLFKEEGNGRQSASVLANISTSLYAQLRFEEALEKALEALSMIEDLEEDLVHGKVYGIVGQGYVGVKNFEQAQAFFQKALPIYETGNNPIQLASIYNLISSSYFQSKEYEPSLAYLNKAKAIYVEIDNERGLLETSRTEGKILTALGRYREATIVLKHNLKDFESKNDLKSLGTTYEFLSKSYEGQGDYKNALDSERKYKILNDSILGENTQKEIAALETLYETQQKENEILRLERENIETQLQAQKQQRILWGTLLALAVIALVAFLFYRNAQKMKSLNNILSEQKQEIEEKNRINEALVKEIHHRVKNNLQVLSSLLNIQTDYIKDKNALDAVVEGRNRVQSMGLIHQKLYTEDNIAALDMNTYLQDLSFNLLDSFGIENGQIQINHQIDVPPLDVDTAIPLGLIINELITNSLKYAFPNKQTGLIHVDLHINTDKELVLTVSDNGIGQSGTNQGTSFGTDLIQILSKKLKGRIVQESDNGFRTVLYFNRYELG